MSNHLIALLICIGIPALLAALYMLWSAWSFREERRYIEAITNYMKLAVEIEALNKSNTPPDEGV
jgi:hypothetical protein